MPFKNLPDHQSAADDLADFIPSRDLPRYFPDLITNSQVQWLMRQRHCNGLDTAVIKIGKKLYIHVPSFRDWVIEQRS